MDKADLAALLDAHGGRAQPVASLHVLRAPTLGDEEHAFLIEHHAELATVDLSRWLGAASAEQRPAVLDALADLAERDPGRFELEIARAPHLDLAPDERAALTGRLHTRVPASVIDALSGDGAGGPRAAPERLPSTPAPAAEGEGLFDPGDLLAGVDFGPGSSSAAPTFSAGPAEDGLGDLLGDTDLFDAPGAGSPAGDEGGAIFGDPFGGGAATPQLDALLGALAELNTARERTAWKARAKALAADPTEDWSRAVTRLPAQMADAVAVRAAASPRPEERATLLEWLLQSGARRARVVELSLALLEIEPGVESVTQWLAQSLLPRVLSDKAAWSKHGAEVLAALAARRAFGEMDQLFTAAVTGAGELGPGLLALPGGGGALCAPIFASFSTMLLDGASRAVAKGQARPAQAFAASLASLGFPSRKASAVAALRRKRGAKGDVARLLGVAPARKPKDVPRLEDFIAAVHVLSDAS